MPKKIYRIISNNKKYFDQKIHLWISKDYQFEFKTKLFPLNQETKPLKEKFKLDYTYLK